MDIDVIKNYNDFVSALLKCGFSMGGGNDKGVFAIIPFGWEEQELFNSPIVWHTGEPETDPWEWRMRVLEERNDIAYSKLFFRTSGYITKEFYPYFYSVRRNGISLEEAFYNGTVSHMAKMIYDIVEQNGATPFHEIKRLGGFSKEDNSRFDRAVVELQMRMFITTCGRKQKINRLGEGYGWSSTVFITVEDFWKERGYDIPDIGIKEAEEKIKTQALLLNPKADEKILKKFIKG